MRALWFDEAGLSLRDVPEPTRKPGEALLRLRLAGICNTDLEIVRGYMGFSGILGHEFVGEVVEHDDSAWLGRRVVGEINLGCGRCETCQRDLARHCDGRSVLGIAGKDGCFAEYLTLPANNLLPVPDEVSDAQAVFTEPTAAAFEILEQLDIGPGMRVAVLGDGKLGSLIAQVLATTGCELVAVGKHPNKLAKLAARGIATAGPDALVGASQDVVVEATGSPAGLSAAIQAVKPRGRVVLKSTFHGQVSLDTAPLIIHEIQLIGSRCGRFAPALEALRSGQVDPRPLVDGTFGLDAGVEAFREAARRGAHKVLIAVS